MTNLRWVRFESAALGEIACEVKELSGEEELNRLFSFAVRLVITDLTAARGLQRELLRRPVTLVLEEPSGELSRVHGVAARVDCTVEPEQDAACFAVTIVPRAWILSLTRRSEIFLDRSVPQILAEKLTGAGFDEGRDFVLTLRERYPVRDFVTQYDESDLDFISRLCEDLGVTFFFQHRDGRDVLVLTDTPDAFEPIARDRPELHVSARREDRAAFDVSSRLERVPEAVLVHDYNYRAPRLDLRASIATGKEAATGSWIEHGVHAKTPEEAAHIARVRAEALGATSLVLSGKSTDRTLRAGATFALIEANGDEHRLLVTKVAHRSHRDGEPASGGDRSWHNEFTAIPAGVPYRPPRRTAKPKVPGLVHAVVDGALEGPYAELDSAGRYKIRFQYDLSGRGGLLASRPIRMIQPHAGAMYGMHFPLRPGTEVLVAFVQGDPDRPVIVGAIPNVETPSPVSQGNQTQNVLRTASFNEVVLEDLRGLERIRVHSPHERTTLQLGSPEEPEAGALTTTDASITAAAARSINEATDHRVLLCKTACAMAGDSAVLLAGVTGLLPAVERGMQRIASVERQRDAVTASLERMADPPGDSATPPPDAGAPATLPEASPGRRPRLWSELLGGLAAHAHEVATRAVAALASATDMHLERSLGRLAGELFGQPARPSAILGSPETAALFGRDSALVSGDRVAALSSQDTASVVGRELAQLKSPRRVEVAGGEETRSTSAGVVDLGARAVRIAGGYYPGQEALPLHPMTSVGVVARLELQLISDADCILVCGHKNVTATAHTGSIKLMAKEQVWISAGSISASAGPIRLTSTANIDVHADGSITVDAAGDVHVKSGGTVKVEAANVEIAAPTTLQGPVTILGDLTVAGTINGKRL